MRTLFDLGRNNSLFLCAVVDDVDMGLKIGQWLNGRICGRYVSVFVQYRWRKSEARPAVDAVVAPAPSRPLPGHAREGLCS